MTTKTLRSAAIIAGIAAMLAGAPAHAQFGKCVAGKQKCTTGELTGLAGCYSKDAKLPNQTALDACIAKVETKYDGGALPEKGCFAKLDAKAPTQPCLTLGDSDNIDNLIHNVTSDLRLLLDPGAPPSTTSACLSGKFKCIANLVKGLEGCEQKNNVVSDPVKYSGCIAKAQAKWDGGLIPEKGCFAKLELKVPPTCVTTGDLGTIKTAVDDALGNINVALACGNSIVGSGEICDDGNRTNEGTEGSCDSSCRTQTCADGIQEGTETCDDGNTSNNDDCPSDCHEDSCTPLSGTTRTATIQWNAPSAVIGITVLLDYPENRVDLPGNGGSIPPGVLTSFPTGTSSQANDLGNQGHALRVVVSKATAITPRPGTLFQANFEDCTGATPPTPADFTCTVLSAFGTDGVTPVAATCTVTSVL